MDTLGISVAETPEQPRIAPLPPAEWPAEMRDALAPLRPVNRLHQYPRSEGRPKGLNVLGTFAHHPELARAFMTFNGHVLFGSTLSPRHRELLVLRVAALRVATYEWEQHVIIAGDNGIDEAVLPQLTAEDLKEIGVATVGDRRKLLAAIRADSDQPVSYPQALK